MTAQFKVDETRDKNMKISLDSKGKFPLKFFDLAFPVKCGKCNVTYITCTCNDHATINFIKHLYNEFNISILQTYSTLFPNTQKKNTLE